MGDAGAVTADRVQAPGPEPPAGPGGPEQAGPEQGAAGPAPGSVPAPGPGGAPWLARLLGFLVVVLIVTGLLLAASHWMLTTFAPTRSVPAVVTAAGRTIVRTSDGTQTVTVFEARTDSGRTVRRDHGVQHLVTALQEGDPVVLRQSRATGDLLGLWTVDGYHRLHLHAGGVLARVIGLGLLGAVLAAPLAGWLYWLRRSRHLPSIAGTVVVPALTAAILLLFVPDPDPDTPPAGGGPGEFDARLGPPEQVVPPGGTAEIGDALVTVTGPPSRGVPAGSPPWLGRFHLLVVPVRVEPADPAGRPRLSLELFDPHRGSVRPVPAGYCGAGPGGYDGGRTPAPPPAAGRVCFALPGRFEPQYLTIGSEAGAGAAIPLIPT